MDDTRYIRITLRIPTELHAKLQRAADKLSHSQNAEIISRLSDSFAKQPKSAPQQVEEMAELIANKVAEKLRT